MLDSTRQFIQAMDAKDIKHSDIEVTQSGMEKVTVIYTGDSIPSIRMIFFFSKDCEDVAIRVFDIQGGQRGQPPLPLLQVRAGHQ